jgi:hypothetical protein
MIYEKNQYFHNLSKSINKIYKPKSYFHTQHISGIIPEWSYMNKIIFGSNLINNYNFFNVLVNNDKKKTSTHKKIFTNTNNNNNHFF